jgi:hypothetical protein
MTLPNCIIELGDKTAVACVTLFETPLFLKIDL